LLYGAACTYDNTPDEDFIIDTLPGHDNTLLITGLSGHGFKFASVLGEIAAQFAQGIAPQFDLTPFSSRVLTDNPHGLRRSGARFIHTACWGVMRKIVSFLMNNIREHFMLYILLWALLAIIDFVYIVFY
jgi:hypothetical protein